LTLFSSTDEAVADEAVTDEGLIVTLPVGTGLQPALTNGAFTENVVNVLLNFEIKEVINLTYVLICICLAVITPDLLTRNLVWSENPVPFYLLRILYLPFFRLC